MGQRLSFSGLPKWTIFQRLGELILVTAGGFQLPLRIEGSLVVGQYMRNVKLKSFAAEGSQLDCLSGPGESRWM